jgi:hypothetical protein
MAEECDSGERPTIVWNNHLKMLQELRGRIAAFLCHVWPVATL